MGEKEEIKNDGEQMPAEVEEKKAVIIVLKMDLHCEGCAKKVRRSISHFEGVENVKVDYPSNKLTVTGNVDPTWLREKVELKTKKKVDLVSPQPKKEAVAATADGGNKKPDEKLEKKDEAKKIDDKKPEEKSEKKDESKKVDDKKPEEKSEKKDDDDKKAKELVISTLVMKIRLHCDGCARKIKRTVLKNIDGVSSVDTNLEKNLVTVIGTMDANGLTAFLKEKLQRGVEIVSPKKDDEDKKANEGCKDKKVKGGAADVVNEKKKETGGEKKPAGGGGEGTRGVEINKLQVHTFNPQTHYAVPMQNQNYIQNHQDYSTQMQMQIYQNQHYPGSSNGYTVQYPNAGYAVPYSQGYEPSPNNVGYAVPYSSQGPLQSGNMPYYPMGPPPPPPAYLNINDQMFSDENPDGCSVM